jgi:hypothetical protein
MSRLSHDPRHLRYLANVLRSEAGLIERHNQVLKESETMTGVFFPVEKSANVSRIANLKDAADVLEAAAGDMSPLK